MSRILVVDDDQNWLEIVCSYLDSKGYLSARANSGRAAIKHIESEDPPLVITDYGMNSGDGGLLARACLSKGIPCIILTSYSSGSVDPYLPKDSIILDKTICFRDDQLDAVIQKMGQLLPAKQLTMIKLLIIEENGEISRSIPSYLEELSTLPYEIEHCESSAQALSLLSENKFDAYLIDENMTKGEIDLIREGRKGGCCGSFIVLTNGLKEIQCTGADNFLSKSDLSVGTLDRSIRFAVERKKRERLITDRQREFSKALKFSAIGEVTAHLTHEIKNPLAIIGGKALRIQNLLSKDEVAINLIKREVGIINETVERISNIINSVQTLSREADYTDLKPVKIKDLLAETSLLLVEKLSRFGIKIQFDEDTAAAEILCVPSEMTQVFCNLVSNAIDAIRDQEEKWINVAATTDEHGTTTISVSDSGMGLEPKQKSNMLKPFYTTKELGKGTGLGLSICKLIVERHNGQLSFDENSEHTTFYFTIPTEGSIQPKKSNIKILIVDDEPDFGGYMIEEFQRAGFPDVHSVYDGYEATQFIQENDVDLIISDVVMPGVNGLDIFRSVEETYTADKKPTFLFVTGHNPNRIPNQILDASLGILSKPFPPNDLFKIINKNKRRIGS